MNKIKDFFCSIGRYFKSVFVSVEGNDPRLKTVAKSKGFASLSASVMAAVGGILIGFIIMLIVNPSQAVQGIGKILAGGITGGAKGIGDVFYYATPIIMTGLSVGFAFKTGLFNIGAPGQYTMGMFCSIFISFTLQNVIPSSLLWIVALLAGMLGGMIWGAIPGIFKAFLNVNEVITSIMTNYIGMFLVDMLIKNSTLIYSNSQARTFPMPVASNIPKFGLNTLFPLSNINGGFLIAVLIAILMFVMLFKTTFGYELRACGTNKFGAKYAGINEKKTIVVSMVIAGGLAGIGGALMIQAGASNIYEPINVLAVNGFNGIAVALLGVNNPLGAIIAGIFFAHLQRGGYYMQLLDFKPEIIDIIIGVIVYFSAFALIIKEYIPKFFSSKSALKDNSDAETSVNSTKEEV